MNPKEKLVEFLEDKHNARVQGNNKWYKLKCPFCGDSPNPNTTHFNIRISPEDNYMVKKCFQPHCTASGVLTQQDLIHMGLSDPEVLNFVSKKTKENKKIVSKINSTKLNLTLPDNPHKIVSDYFLKRTNEKLNKENIKRFRVVSNITKFYEDNKDKIEYSKRIGMLRNKESEKYHYIGFINETGTFLHVRSIDDRKIKHMKIPLVNLPFYVNHQPYSLKNNFDIKKKMYGYLGEGIFDVINALLYFNDPGFYVQTGTANGFFSQFKTFSKYYYNVQWVVLKDEDVNISLFKKLKSIYDYRFKDDLIVISNEASKDIGDFSKPIKIKKIKI